MNIKEKHFSWQAVFFRLPFVLALIAAMVASVPAGGAAEAASLSADVLQPGGERTEAGGALLAVDTLPGDAVDLRGFAPLKSEVENSAPEAPDVDPIVAITDDAVSEANAGTEDAIFVVYLDAVPTQDITVTWSITDVTAIAPGDYSNTPITGTLNFSLGGTSAHLIFIDIYDDAKDEYNETFHVVLESAENATISSSDGTGVGLILDDDALPSLTIDDNEILEGDPPITSTLPFTATLTGESEKTVTVGYSTANVDASAGIDYEAISGVFTFNPGTITQTVSVIINGDTDSEPHEKFNVNLFSAVNAQISDGMGVGTIYDDDPPKVHIRNSDPVDPEGDSGSTTDAVFEVELDHSSGLPITVTYTTEDNEATLADGDYVFATGQVTFTPGMVSKYITITVNGDDYYEENELFRVRLTDPVNAVSGDMLATANIINDDDPPEISIDDVTVTEGDTGVTVDAVFTVSLSTAAGRVITVKADTLDGTATAADGDFDPFLGVKLTFPAGSTTQYITVTVNGDVIDEFDETFSVTLKSPTPLAVPIGDASALGTILDDDAEPDLSVVDGSGIEGDSGPVDGEFWVSLSLESGKPITVTYATTDVNAIEGTDYSEATGELVFLPGTSVQTATVQIIGDTLVEVNETLSVTLANNENAGIDDGAGLVTILDDDPTVASIVDASADPETDAGNTEAVFAVTLAEPSGMQVTLDYATTPGTAEANVDYVTQAGQVTFDAEVTTQYITVTVNSDTLDEDDETFNVTLSTPSNVSIGDGDAVGTIVDDDPLSSLSIDDVMVSEGDTGTVNAVFTVSLSPITGRTVMVDYATANIEAAAGQDYQTASGTLTFDPGVATRTIVVPVFGDDLDEIDETFAVNLSNPVKAEIGDGSGVGTITDDDGESGLSIADVVVIEGDSGTVEAVFVVNLGGTSSKQVAADYATSDGTAIAGSDYVADTGRVIVAPGALTGTISVTVNSDMVDEEDETFTVTLSNPENAEISDATAEGTITDDDPFPTLSIDDVFATEGDSGTTEANFTISLSSISEKTVTVSYATANGTASSGDDYEDAAGTLTFAPGTTTQTATVTVKSDNQGEPNEVFFINMSNPNNAMISDVQGVCTILDDDGLVYLPIMNRAFISPGINVTPSSGLVTTEMGDVITLTVSLKTQPESQVNVNLASQDETEGVLSVSTLVFRPDDWDQPRTVFLTGVDDLGIDGDQDYVLEFVALSSQFEYDNLALNLSATNLDNDVFEDPFDEAKGWQPISEPDASASLVTGEYLLRLLSADKNFKTIAPFGSASMPAAFAIEADARINQGSHLGTGYGLLFNYINSSRYYRFNVTPETQAWQVYIYDDGWNELASGTSAAILQAYATNRLKVEREGEQIRVYANDQLLWEGTDGTFLTGRSGLILFSSRKLGSTDYSEVAFDDYLISDLNPE